MVTGETLIGWGYTPGKWFKDALARADGMERDGASVEEIRAEMDRYVPEPIRVQEYRTNAIPFAGFIEADTEVERLNVAAVMRDMDALMRVPPVQAGAVMPDACPAGIIPVGGVVASEAVHPGFHSADICCSMAISVLKRSTDVKAILDTAQRVTHFGPGKRSKSQVRQKKDLMALLRGFDENRFLRQLEGIAEAHFMTQGDGNHFLFVGTLRSTGQTAIVTHHGSRGLGAQLHKRGMAAAQRHTSIVSPRTPSQAAWLRPEDTDEYWDALQTIREWTKMNHFAIHDSIASSLGNRVEDRFWNEHNFVFRKSDGMFYHGKGATPNWSGYAPDDSGLTLVPLNMAEPILVLAHTNNPYSLGFAPHGAGRNMSRTQFLRENRPKLPAGIDVRFYCGKPDLSELPEAYKNAASVRSQIEKFDLGKVVDLIDPLGSMMAGDWEADAPWRKPKGDF